MMSYSFAHFARASTRTRTTYLSVAWIVPRPGSRLLLPIDGARLIDLPVLRSRSSDGRMSPWCSWMSPSWCRQKKEEEGRRPRPAACVLVQNWSQDVVLRAAHFAHHGGGRACADGSINNEYLPALGLQEASR